MAGEIQLNSVSLATESGSAITLGSAVSLNSAAYATTSEVQGTHTTGSITSGTTSLTVASGSGISNGDYVVGEGITPGTTVSSGGGTTSITLSANAAATLSSDPVSFYTANKALSPGLVAGGLCRAWVNFDGTGTVAINAAHNVSSITDNGGSGDYTVNYSTNMPDDKYSIVLSFVPDQTVGNGVSAATRVGFVKTINNSDVRILVGYMEGDGGTGGIDFSYISVAVFR
jgi:hypothetical protein